MKLRVLDLFSGIGGFSLGLERTGGFETVAFCEIEDYPRRVLAKHWPGIYIHGDIRTLTKETLCKGYAENALLSQLCKETGGNSASVRDAITHIREHEEARMLLATMSESQSVEGKLSTIMAENAPVVENENTLFWQSTTNLITEMLKEKSTKGHLGKTLSNADFQTITKFFVTTVIWQKPSTVPAHIKEMAGCYHDTADTLRRDGITVDVICGGFPCQNISAAGKREGIGGSRSGLWSEYARLVCEIRPKFVIVENSAELLYRGLGVVLGSLAPLGFGATWECIPAAVLGAPHGRDRVWIVAYAEKESGIYEPNIGKELRRWLSDDGNAWPISSWSSPSAAVCRVDDGIPDRVDRTGALGNSVIHFIPRIIGQAILESLKETA